jgi:hypothetical protein
MWQTYYKTAGAGVADYYSMTKCGEEGQIDGREVALAGVTLPLPLFPLYSLK